MTVAIDPDAPWWVNAIVVVLVAIIIAGGAAWGAWLTQRSTKRDVTAIKDQVKNTHTTNLREDLDRLHRKVDGAREDIADMRGDAAVERRSNATTRDEVRDLRRDFNKHVKSDTED